MTTKEFIQFASERPELCEKISAFTDAEEAYAFAQTQGVTDDMATFIEIMSTVRKETEALTDSDLESINAAGYTLATDIVRTVSSSVVAAAMFAV